jgi:hypothetical protein
VRRQGQPPAGLFERSEQEPAEAQRRRATQNYAE